MKRYDAYIFDLYGTLVDIHTDESRPLFWKKVAEFYTLQGVPYQPMELKQAYLGLVKELEEKLASARNSDAHEAHPEIELGEVFERLYIEKKKQADQQLIMRTAIFFRQASTTHIRLYSGAKELLGALRDSGGKVYLLSNAQRIFTEPELEMLGLIDCFDDIVISSDYGCKKPDLEFYRKLIERNRLEPARCLMIGNDPVCDIWGAQNAGMDSYYIHSALSPQPAPPSSGRGKLQTTYYQEGMDLHKVRRKLL